MIRHQEKARQHQLLLWDWTGWIFCVIFIVSPGLLRADPIENVGTWYEEDTLYVYQIRIPGQQNITSMKVQEKNKNGRFITVGSPRIQVIPAFFVGKEIVFTRSKSQIDSEIGPSSQLPEFRIAFYQEGLAIDSYGSLTRTVKPNVDFNLSLISQSSYPVPSESARDSNQVSSVPKREVEQNSEQRPVPKTEVELPKPSLISDTTATSKPGPPPTVAKPMKEPPVKPAPKPAVQNTVTPSDTCECDDDSTAAKPKLKNTAGNQSKKVVGKSGQNASTIKKPVNSTPTVPKHKVVPKEPSKAPWGTVFNQGILNGLVLETSMASPYWVSKNLTTWYSSIDWRFSFTAPYYYHWGPVMIGLTFERSSFDFENTFPEGGRFQGQAHLGYLTTYWRGLIFEFGGGQFTDTYGLIGGVSGKILEGEHLYLGGGLRGVFIQDILTIGRGTWADGRLTLGYKF